MRRRHALGLAVGVVLLAACTRTGREVEVSPELGRITVTEPLDAGATAAKNSRDAAPPDEPDPLADDDDKTPASEPNRGCPQGATWNGKACVGFGYVACRPGEYLQGDTCAKPKLAALSDAGFPPLATPSSASTASAERTETGAIECDRYLDQYARCLKRSLPSGMKIIQDAKKAYRIMLSDAKLRDQVRQSCETARKQLSKTCP